YIGVRGTDEKLATNRLLFAGVAAPGEDNKPLQYFAPVRLGYRQLPIERWTAAPLYRLKLSANTARDSRELHRVPRPPFTVNLVRTPPGETLAAADDHLADKEA